MMQGKKIVPNIKNFFNPKTFFVGFITITTMFIIPCYAGLYLLTSLWENGIVNSYYLDGLPSYLLQLLITTFSIVFFFWKKEYMKKIQKIAYCFIIISYCLYCTLVFLDLETSGIMALRDYFAIAVPKLTLLFLVYLITQVASVFIENKIFWYFVILLGISFFILASYLIF